MNEIPSPSGRLAWNLILASVAAVALAAGVGAWPPGSGFIGPSLRLGVSAVLLTAAWLAAARFLIIDTWGRWLWLVLLACSSLLAALLGNGGLPASITLTVFVLTLRTYRPWRHIPARLRALGFGLGLIAVVLLILAARFWDLSEPENELLAALRRLGGWSVGSLLTFWLWSLFHLAVRMRLHFLRLRPKLAVSALLIGLVPLVLVGILAVLVLYLGLGGARATRATNVLEDWRSAAAAGVDLSGAPFDTTFAWPERVTMSDRAERIPAPPWVTELADAMEYTLVQIPASEGNTVAASLDTTGWFAMDGNIWLMDWRGVGTDSVMTRAWCLGTGPLERLSRLLGAGLRLASIKVEQTERATGSSPATTGEIERFPGRRIVYRDVSQEEYYWSEYIHFGGTTWPLSTVQNRELHNGEIFLQVRAGWQDLKTDFAQGENVVNRIVVVVLGIVAGLFLILEIFALFFGIRITEGIIAAVRRLQRGTRALGAGDLDTVIDLPNEDEFGDLADSFNEMTRAVKRGREDALARQALTRELVNARAIQKRLLPAEEPSVVGFEVTGASIPSREIGGDYFDFILQADECLGVAIGDVSGKGMPAALLMSGLQASLHGQVLHPSSVSETVGRVNDLMVASTDPHMFATFFYGVLDLNAGTFTSTNAGHNPPLVLRNSGEMELLGTGGLLLGMLSGQSYQQEVTSLEPGEVIVLYTDGITEAVGPSAEEDDPEAMFGEDPLAEVVRRNAHLPAVGIKEAILDAVREHTAGVPQSDDITLVVIRRQE